MLKIYCWIFFILNLDAVNDIKTALFTNNEKDTDSDYNDQVQIILCITLH